ncbi:hypothetical protein B566_EDAN000785 [Ephemera danica]|nr:hypothetical protein B566_EDAN000785 [Ephemera danica]
MLEKPPSLLNMLSIRSILFCVVFIFTISSCVGKPGYEPGKSGFSGMKCEGNKRKFMISILDDTMMSCPPLFGDKDDKYCCTREDGRSYCCDESEYLREYGMGFVVPVLVSVLVALTMVCCVCCLCCPCCLWYKRRNRGTVYNSKGVF